MSDTVTSSGKNQPIVQTDIRARSITNQEIAQDTILGENVESLDIVGKSITADTGAIGGWELGANGLTGSDESYIRGGQDAFNSGLGYFMGFEGGVPVFSLGDSSGDRITWDPVNGLQTTGITATVADIGGFIVGAETITDVADSFGLSSEVTGDDDVRFWAGADTASKDTAPFRVTESGNVSASSIEITGGSITGDNMVSVNAVNLASRGWIQDCIFSSSSPTVVEWTSGTFTSANGDTFAIDAGSTPTMSARTYIYLDLTVSVTEYQASTTPEDAIGNSKVLVAVAEDNADGAVFQVLDGSGRYIDASEIVANSITANELSTSILYAGSLEVDEDGNIRSGQTDFNTGVGWFIGSPSGVPKFSIGDPAGDSMTWDGTTFKAVGSIVVSSVLNNARYVIADLPLSPSSTSFNDPGGNA